MTEKKSKIRVYVPKAYRTEEPEPTEKELGKVDFSSPHETNEEYMQRVDDYNKSIREAKQRK